MLLQVLKCIGAGLSTFGLTGAGLSTLGTKLLNNQGFSYLKKTYVTQHIIQISLVSLFLLIVLSPIFSLLWLCITTLYLLYIRSYNEIFKIWFVTIITWYLIFTTSLAEITIIIGFENTKIIFNYLLNNDFMFANLVFQTVYILDSLSANLGFSIYLPAPVHFFSFIFKFFKNIKTECSGQEDSGSKKSSWFSSKETKSKGEKDLELCSVLAAEMKRANYLLHSTERKTDGERTVAYSQTWVPFWGTLTQCSGRDANEFEKDLYNRRKKK